MATDLAGGRLFISDSSNNRIVVTDLKGKFLEHVSVLALPCFNLPCFPEARWEHGLHWPAVPCKPPVPKAAAHILVLPGPRCRRQQPTSCHPDHQVLALLPCRLAAARQAWWTAAMRMRPSTGHRAWPTAPRWAEGGQRKGGQREEGQREEGQRKEGQREEGQRPPATDSSSTNTAGWTEAVTWCRAVGPQN